VTGLYLHVPFCRRKCAYCDFYSLSAREDTLPRYVTAVLEEARAYSGLAFDTLYLGGGTPSLLGPELLSVLMAGLHRVFDLSHLTEATIEANPESSTPLFLAAARGMGFDRLSLGVQSLDDAELAAAGRVHTAAQALTVLEGARRAGFTAVSADVIAGLPAQTETSLHRTLEILVGKVAHLSFYCLSLEPETPLALTPPPNLLSEDEQADLFLKSRLFLLGAGLHHYEISNFARPGHECRHNQNYWYGGEYLGLGPAAASHLGGRRFRNRPDLDAYLAAPAAQVTDQETLPPSEKAAEEAMLRLRLLEEGLDIAEMASRHGPENVRHIEGQLAALVREGRLLREGQRYRLASDTILTANQVFRRILPN
jgi:oxygen-independent coproporphyrinogen-3 oxidase